MQNRDPQQTVSTELSKTVEPLNTTEEEKSYPQQLVTLANKKKLDYKAFQATGIELKDDIATHAAWAFKNIYSIPYPNSREQDIPRLFHGIQHVSRAAMYIPVFANLYRKYSDKDALNLTPEEIQLLQIAVLFHDAAREDEHADRWDHESALLLYYYLTHVLKLTHDQAKLYAEAVANKDTIDSYSREKEFQELIFNEKKELTWSKSQHRPKNIYQKLIHDADCLDIIRARNHFDANYLEFYKQISATNLAAFDDMAYLIIDARNIIETQGDGRSRVRQAIKKLYENENAYPAILNTLKSSYLRILPHLHAEGRLLSTTELQKNSSPEETTYDKTKGYSPENLNAALRAGKIIARSITTPSSIRDKTLAKKDRYGYEKKYDFSPQPSKEYPEETLAQVEIRKMQRRLNIATRTDKYDRLEKDGNPNRSFSLIGWGATTYGEAGYLIIDPDLNDIRKISNADNDSGRWKKKISKYFEKKISPEEKTKELNDVLRNQKMGGNSSQRNVCYPLTHNEITYDVRDYHAVYFLNEPNAFNGDVTNSPYPAHTHAPALQAIYLQKEYTRAQNKTIPICEYSSFNNYILPKEYTAEQIEQMWFEMCTTFMKQKLAKQDHYFHHSTLADLSIDSIKTLSMYKHDQNRIVKRNAPADTNYDAELKHKINANIAAEKSKLIAEYKVAIAKDILTTNASAAEDSKLFICLMHNLELLAQTPIKDKLTADIELEMILGIEYQRGNGNHSHAANIVRVIYPTNPPLSQLENFEIRSVAESKILRLYALAELVGHQECINKIKEIVITELKKQVEDKDKAPGTDNSLVKLYCQNNITTLMAIAAEFNIYKELKDDIEPYVNNYMKQRQENINKDSSPIDWRHYYSVVKEYHELKLLTKASLQEIRKSCLELSLKVKETHVCEYFLAETYFDNAELYLDLAEIAGIPVSEKRAVIIEFLHNCVFTRKTSTYDDYSYGDHRSSQMRRFEEQVDQTYNQFFKQLPSKLALDWFHELKDFLDPTTSTGLASRQESLNEWFKNTTSKLDQHDFPWLFKIFAPQLTDIKIFQFIITKVVTKTTLEVFQQQIELIKYHVPGNEFTPTQTKIINSEKDILRHIIRYKKAQDEKEEKLLTKKSFFGKSVKKPKSIANKNIDNTANIATLKSRCTIM